MNAALDLEVGLGTSGIGTLGIGTSGIGMSGVGTSGIGTLKGIGTSSNAGTLAGIGLLQDWGADTAPQPAGARTAAWIDASSRNTASTLDASQQAIGPAEMRRGFLAPPSSGPASFQANLQSLLRDWGVSQPAGAAENTSESGAAESAPAGRAIVYRTDGNIASCSRIAGSFAGSRAPGARQSLPAAGVNSRELPQPRSGVTTAGTRPQASLRRFDNDARKPLSLPNSPASGQAARATNSKHQEPAMQEPAASSYALTVTAAPGETSTLTAVAVPIPVAIPEQAVSGSSAMVRQPEADSFDRTTQEERNSGSRPGLAAVSETPGAARADLPPSTASPAKGAASQQADSRRAAPRETPSTATESERSAASTSRASLAASNGANKGRENLPAVASGYAGPRESENSPLQIPVAGKSANGNQSNTSVEAAGRGAPSQAGPHPSEFISTPAAQSTPQANLESSAQNSGEARSRVVPQARAAEAKSILQGTQAAAISVGTGAANWVHVAESAQAPATPRVAAAEAPISAPPAIAKETFAALDMETGVTTPRWIHAGGHQAEAGFQDPTLGWVGVRADLSGGSVHAALVPTTSEAGQALSAHMAGLSAYLSEQHVPVTVLTLVDSPAGAGASQQQMQQGAGQNAEGGEATKTEPWRQSGGQAAATAPTGSIQTQGSVFGTVGVYGDSRGTHISVMA